MMVKICGITSREDAMAAVEAGAAAIGFNFFHHSPRYVTPEHALHIQDGLAVTKVGIFVNETPAMVTGIMSKAGLDIAQVYGDLRYAGLRTWRACRVRSADFKLPDPEDGAEAFLLDGFSPDAYGGTGRVFPWSIARGLHGKIVLAGGLGADNVRDAIRQAEPWGVDACSRVEKAPGRKDHDKMKRFIEAALSTSI